MKISWYSPKFGVREKELVNKVLDDAYVNEGPMCKEVEKKISEFLKIKHVILTTSGTAALFLALKADQVIRNLKDYEVIVPDFTCVASANSIRWAGAKEVLVDVNCDDYCISIEDVKRKITSKTKVILITQIIGRCCNMEELNKIAKEHGLIIIEDVAGALGSKYKKDYIGTIGKAGCFSLQANKIISCGQGGIVVTNDDEYANKIRRIRDQGRLNKSDLVYPIEGYNLKLNDILAAVVLGQLEDIENRIKNLISQRKQYEKELKDVKEIFLPKTDYENGCVPLWIDPLAENSEKLGKFLVENGITIRKPGWPPVHRNGTYMCEDERFPNSTYISDNSLWVPNGPTITPEEISYICDKIKEFYKNNPGSNFSFGNRPVCC